jgi:hypothetical protein
MFWVTVTGKDYVLLLGGREGDSPALFNMKEDPDQENNIYYEQHEKALEMTRALCDYLRELGADQVKIEALSSRVEK